MNVPTTLRKARLLAAYPGAIVRRPRAALRYLLRDREFTNLTYDIENEQELAELIASALGQRVDEIAAYVAEPAADGEMLDALRATLRSRSDRNDEPMFGRRLGWYALVRALRPGVVMETGVHDGLGSALLLRALDRNGTGRLVGFDIDEQSGWLVPAFLRPRYRLIAGDIRETLPAALADGVDMFIHDSLHTYEHERFELRIAVEAGATVLVSDNSHVSPALAEVCRDRGLRYSLFRECPRDHFYPGAGLGLAVTMSSDT